MSLRSNDRQWGSVAKFFHWIIALGILGNGIFGLLMDLAHSPMQKINWLALHKSIGLTVLALVLLRMLWRWADGRPREEPAPRWQQLAAQAAHGVLYVLIVLLPLSGWWFNSVSGKPLQWFKQFNLPALVAKNDDAARFRARRARVPVLVPAAGAGGACRRRAETSPARPRQRVAPDAAVRPPARRPSSEGDHR